MGSISSSEEHGGVSPRELSRLGISARDLVDFSVNSNPFGPSPRVLEALRAVDISSYPDRDCSELTDFLAAANRVSPGQVLVGNGTSELIWLVSQAFLKPGDEVLIVGPTFGEYRRAAAALGARVTEIRAKEPDFHPPLEEIIRRVEQDQPRLVFLCNPNNPIGSYLSPEAVSKLAAACGPGAILVLDEAYRSFVAGDFFPGLPEGNCLVLWSMTKDFALAGLRLGYALGNPEWIERIRSFQPAWSVNALALAAGAGALADLDYYRKTLSDLAGLKVEFFSHLRNLGWMVVPSDVHFGLVHAGSQARDLRLRLLQLSIQVRDCTSFGLPDYIRVSTRLPADNLKLLQTLSEINSLK
ncbi:MAG: histidinol-phosphate transaminase [Anaerolineaceae bacterium]